MRPGWNQPEPDPDRGAPPAATVVVRTGSQPRILTVGSVLVALFLLIAIVKPWGAEALPLLPEASGPPSQSPAAVAGAATTPTVSPSRSRAEAIASECRAPAGWRIVTHQRWLDQDLRIWWAIAPVAATSAWDPSIPFLSISADPVVDLGYCGPLFGPDRPPSDATVGVWRVDPVSRTIERLPLERVAPEFEDALVAMYAPPGSDEARAAQQALDGVRSAHPDMGIPAPSGRGSSE